MSFPKSVFHRQSCRAEETESYFRILSIGPTFSVDAEATATIDTYFNLSVSVAYDVQNMQVLFTPGSHSQTGIILPRQEGGVMLSASPSVSSQGQLAAHLIPSVSVLPILILVYHCVLHVF